MKYLVLVVLSYAIASDAYPSLLPVIGNVGKKIGSGVGGEVGLSIGTAVNVGAKKAEHLGAKVVGVGLGALDFGSGLVVGLGTGLSNGLGAGLSLTGVKGRDIQGGKYDQQRNRGRRSPGPYRNQPLRNIYPKDGPFRNGPNVQPGNKRDIRSLTRLYEDDGISRKQAFSLSSSSESVSHEH